MSFKYIRGSLPNRGQWATKWCLTDLLYKNICCEWLPYFSLQIWKAQNADYSLKKVVQCPVICQWVTEVPENRVMVTRGMVTGSLEQTHCGKDRQASRDKNAIW